MGRSNPSEQFLHSTRTPPLVHKTQPQEMDALGRLKLGITLGLLFGIFFICLLFYFILNRIEKHCNEKDSGRNKDGKHRRQKKIFSRLNLFSGGVFFATSFLHLLPEAKEEMEKFFELASATFDFPASEFIVSLGFFLVLFAEQLTSKVHRTLEARKKAKETLILSAIIPNANNVAINDNENEEHIKHSSKRKADESLNGSLFREIKSEISDFPNQDNKRVSITCDDDEVCKNCNSSLAENPESPRRAALDKKLQRDEDFVTVPLYNTMNKNEYSTTSEPFGAVIDHNPSTLTLHSKGSLSLRKFQPENSLTVNQTPILSPPNLVYCNCNLKTLHKHVHSDSIMDEETRCESGSYLEKTMTLPSKSEEPGTQSKREGYRAIILLVSLLFHSLFDGLALGLQTSSSKVYTIMIAIVFHKSLVAFSLTLKFYRAFPGKVRFVVVCLFIFSIISPIGSLIGWLVSGSDSIHIAIRAGCSGILQSLATGTFLYVTFIEILGPELGHGQARLTSIFFVFIGFISIAIMKFFL